MTRRTFVYDRDLDAMVEITSGSNAEQEPRRSDGVQIIRDVEPYKAIAADVDGSQPVIGGRRQHREFIARNKYIEVGNDTPPPRENWVTDRQHTEKIRAALKEAGAKVAGWL